MEHTIAIAIGDWSDDGHGKCEYIHFKSNKPIDDVREAYFKAGENHEDLLPENFCSEYEEGTISPEYMAPILEAFPGIAEHLEQPGEGEDYYANVEFMTELVRRFIQLGDPEIQLEKMAEAPTLHFYGYDEKKRHIGYIGYGLFY